MRCQVCDSYSSEDIAEYNEQTGKMDFICNTCKVIHHEVMDEYVNDDEWDDEGFLIEEDTTDVRL